MNTALALAITALLLAAHALPPPPSGLPTGRHPFPPATGLDTGP